MKNLVFTILLGLFATSFTYASPWEIALCPPFVGTFTIERGALFVTIVKENDKAVRPHTERLANPPAGKEADALSKRGAVQFNAHVDKESGRLFVHWETVKSARP